MLTDLAMTNVFLQKFSKNFSIGHSYKPAINNDEANMLNRLQLLTTMSTR